MSIALLCCLIVILLASYTILLGIPIAPILLLAHYNGNKLGLYQSIPLYIALEGHIAAFAPLLLAHFVGLLGLFNGLQFSFDGLFCLFSSFAISLPLSTLRLVWSPRAVAFGLHVCAGPALLAFCASAYILHPLPFTHNLNYL